MQYVQRTNLMGKNSVILEVIHDRYKYNKSYFYDDFFYITITQSEIGFKIFNEYKFSESK